MHLQIAFGRVTAAAATTLPRQQCRAMGGNKAHLQPVALAGKGVQDGSAGLQRLIQHTAAGGHAVPRPGIVFSLPEAQQALEGSG